MINPKIWGKHGWIFLHLVSLSYPDKPTNEDKKKFKNFFIDIQNILPCSVCQENYKKHLIQYPLNDKVFENKENLVNWLIDIHNCVNKINNKKIYSYDEAKQLLIEIQNTEIGVCKNPIYYPEKQTQNTIVKPQKKSQQYNPILLVIIFILILVNI